MSDEIRNTVEGCGLSRYAIAKATGIDNATLSRFISQERGLPMKTLDVLAEFLDLHIVVGKHGKSKGGRK